MSTTKLLAVYHDADWLQLGHRWTQDVKAGKPTNSLAEIGPSQREETEVGITLLIVAFVIQDGSKSYWRLRSHKTIFIIEDTWTNVRARKYILIRTSALCM